jgi:hypothetical protein
VRGTALSSSRSSRSFAIKIPFSLAGRAAAPPNFIVDRGSWGLGAWGRVCGPREALWLTIQRRGTFLDAAH